MLIMCVNISKKSHHIHTQLHTQHAKAPFSHRKSFTEENIVTAKVQYNIHVWLAEFLDI